MSHRIKKVQYLDGFRLELFFDDGKVKVVDLEGIVREGKNMFIPLKDLEYFKKVKCDSFSIVWPNGVDLCPDVLYAMGKNICKSTKKQEKRATTKSKSHRKLVSRKKLRHCKK